MLVMHYRIALPDQEAVTAVRMRAAERGPLFDGMAGLVEKLFLIDPSDPCYATYYLWRDPDAALGFLNGPFFAALTQSFGRPEVRLFLTDATKLPDRLDIVRLSEQENLASSSRDIVRALDPRTGSVLVLSEGVLPGRRFEVMYHAIGGAR